MLFQLRRRRRIWRGKSRGGERREGSDITLMHRCKSSCNRDVCLSAMSERTTGLIMSGKKKDKGMRSSDAFLRAAHCQLICVCSTRRNATTERARGQQTNRGAIFTPRQPNAECLCSGIFAAIARELNNGRVQGTVVSSLLVRSCDAIIPDISLTLPSPESSLNAASSSANSHPLSSSSSSLSCMQPRHNAHTK